MLKRSLLACVMLGALCVPVFADDGGVETSGGNPPPQTSAIPFVVNVVLSDLSILIP